MSRAGNRNHHSHRESDGCLERSPRGCRIEFSAGTKMTRLGSILRSSYDVLVGPKRLHRLYMQPETSPWRRPVTVDDRDCSE